MKAKTIGAEEKRIAENLAYIAANPSAVFPSGWIAEVRAEAIRAGMIQDVGGIGCNCRPGIDDGIIYGGDMVDVF